MNIKKLIKKTATMTLALSLTIGATGCVFLVTDSQKDLAQTVASVNISKDLKKAGLSCADEVQTMIDAGGLSTEVKKRQLVTSFMNTGYTYVQNYGYTYEQTFNLLMDELVENVILTQYATAYFLEKDSSLSAEACLDYVEAETNKATGREKELLKAHPQVLTMTYFLTQGAEGDEKEYFEAVYNLKKMLNSSLDNAESGYIIASSHDHTHEEVRTKPTNVSKLDDEYVPMKDGKLNYDVYTGRNTPDSCGEYERITDSTTTSRKKAYNSFIANMQGYDLIKEGEDTAVITQLDYYYLELSSALSSALVEKYAEDLKDEAIAKLDDSYVSAKYEEIKSSQKTAYEKDSTAFDTALDSVSDNSFLLYGQKDFGFVYNILIPFSASQELDYTAAKTKFGSDKDGLYNARKAILEKVEAKDLRTTWFCADNEDEHFAYEATEGYFNNNGAEKDYLFFEDHFKGNEKYKSLTQYLGQYPYKGKAEIVDNEYKFTPVKMDIDEFIAEMEDYIDYSLGGQGFATGSRVNAYGNNKYDTAYTDAVSGKVDFSKFMYYTGKVNLTNTSRSDFFNKNVGTTAVENDSYKALSAVNELMFAYSTDTGCLNTYMGYVVSPYKTDFVSEFEYAAQYVVKQGVGSYVVAPSDYGWHIIYCSFVYDADDGDVYGGFKAEEKEIEGTFSYLFYESLKSTSATSYTTNVQKQLLNQYKTDDSVVLYKKAYKDLLTLDK